MEHATLIGARIRAHRVRRGLTAAALAKQVGITENAVRKIESGDSKEPRFSTGVRIAQVLDVDPRDLLGPAIISPSDDGNVPRLADVLRVIRSCRAALSDDGVGRVAVFGSVARGEARPDSDVDVFVYPAEGHRFTLFDIAGAQITLEKALGRKVDVVTSGPFAGSPAGDLALSEAVYAF